MKSNNCIYIIAVFIFASCKSQPQHPEVFLGFKLGSSETEMVRQRDELLKSNLIEIKENLFVHSAKAKGLTSTKTYYATPIFNVSPGDTQCSKITVLYFDDLSYISNIARELNEGNNRLQFYLSKKMHDEIKPGQAVKNDVLNQLATKYGNFTASDTSYDAVGVYQEGYVWNNGNGLLINLNYGVWKSAMINAAALRLEFSFTEEMKKKLFKKISPY